MLERTHPALGEVFELTLEPVKGLQIVEACRYLQSEWEFRGKEITKRRTRRFKLVHICYQQDFKSLLTKLREYGRPAKGQWLLAFKRAFPKPGGYGPIGFADASWRTKFRGNDAFPYIMCDGRCNFGYRDSLYSQSHWRWVVEVVER